MRPATVVSAILLAVIPLAAQQPAPPPPADRSQQAPLTFKVEVNYVEIDATVTDAQGNPLRDLARGDFEILEEGRPQALTIFSHVEIPIERPDPPLFRAAAVEPDVRSNRREFDGRVFVLVLDDLHTSFTRTARVRTAATEFIQRYLGANDLVAVVTTSGSRGGGQEFTNSRPLLMRAVNQFAGRKLPSPSVERLREAQAGRALRDPNEAERAHKARNLLTALKGLAE
ncbi:MAG: VWA domain-containing protein, partial [Vicinamibacterales bacterium]